MNFTNYDKGNLRQHINFMQKLCISTDMIYIVIHQIAWLYNTKTHTFPPLDVLQTMVTKDTYSLDSVIH